MFTGLVLSVVNRKGQKHDQKKEKRKLHITAKKKLVTAKKATTNRTKSEFLSQCRIVAKTNFLFPARFEHARYSSRMIDRFLTGAIMETEKRQDQRPLPATAWSILILAGKRDSRRHLILQVIKCYKFHHFAIGSEARSTYFTSGGKKYSDVFRYVYFWRIRKKKTTTTTTIKVNLVLLLVLVLESTAKSKGLCSSGFLSLIEHYSNCNHCGNNCAQLKLNLHTNEH